MVNDMVMVMILAVRSVLAVMVDRWFQRSKIWVIKPPGMGTMK